MESSPSLALLLFSLLLVTVNCNFEGDILYAWKTKLVDPYNVLSSWDPTQVNPCTWFHITCNFQNNVVRLDLGNASLSGVLAPELGQLKNLRYLEVFGNKLTGSIPSELGRLSNLISLDLYNNQLSGEIPSTLGYLKKIAYLRVNGNNLSGKLPAKILQLIQYGNLKILDVSSNQLAGTVHGHKNKTETVITQIVQDAKVY